MDVPIKNNSNHELELGLEPEGDVISLAPGDQCVVQLAYTDNFATLDFNLEYRGGAVSLNAMSSKAVFLEWETDSMK